MDTAIKPVKKPRVKKPKPVHPETFGPLIPYHVSYNYYGFIYKITIVGKDPIKDPDITYVGKKPYRSKANWTNYIGSGKQWLKTFKANAKKKIPNVVKYEVIAQGKNESDLQNLEVFHITSEWVKLMEHGNINNNRNYDNGTGRVKRRAWLDGYICSKSVNRYVQGAT